MATNRSPISNRSARGVVLLELRRRRDPARDAQPGGRACASRLEGGPRRRARPLGPPGASSGGVPRLRSARPACQLVLARSCRLHAGAAPSALLSSQTHLNVAAVLARLYFRLARKASAGGTHCNRSGRRASHSCRRSPVSFAGPHFLSPVRRRYPRIQGRGRSFPADDASAVANGQGHLQPHRGRLLG